MKTPQVTVLMPVYNAEAYLRGAIESILGQTFTDFEFLIIDDGSTDASSTIIHSFSDPRITVIQHRRNKRLIATLNEGIAKAKASLIARMDADDISLPKRLEKQLQFLKKHPEVVALGCEMNVINEIGSIVSREPLYHTNEELQLALVVTNIFPHGSVIFRKAAVELVGGYSPAAYLVEDYDLWTRLARVGKLANLSQALYCWRLNPAGESLSKATAQRRNVQAITDVQWRRFGAEGPAPRRLWSDIWPTHIRTYPHLRRRQYAELHLHFTRGYFKRGNRLLAVQHALAALAIIPTQVEFYFYLLTACLPIRLFFALENQAFVFRKRIRGW